ncbi:hypothetical protein IE81DRAFT_324819 [Ceraceosorus guamensis]|uniref:Small ribosomal subunit protein mS35 mitochondrial conserved domain-containing protein n=1 Tax=Ceraceosorus guamensis TaxID=1522189 RepID=A0A316VUF0_9BASI|nr:hypothetical protein IE81DRAFT_324819 [Ceraceosorus guamensis]PWN41207.1 hypothetical protein IE81DRAFT_324819 [Ceraceosorus guamensis]
MASSSSLSVPLARSARPICHALSRSRAAFSTSAPDLITGKGVGGRMTKGRRDDSNKGFELEKMGTFEYDDLPSGGHAVVQRQRELLKYYRLAEHEMPKLTGFAKSYEPPKDEEVIQARSLHYQGQIHPAGRKVVVTSRISKLLSSGALHSTQAAHKLKLLASTHFKPDDPIDAFALKSSMLNANAKTERGTTRNEDGVIKISCERFPQESQNLRWAAERVQLLCEEANRNPDEYASVPLDPRQHLSKAVKKGGMPTSKRVTIKDFPQHWL